MKHNNHSEFMRSVERDVATASTTAHRTIMLFIPILALMGLIGMGMVVYACYHLAQSLDISVSINQ